MYLALNKTSLNVRITTVHVFFRNSIENHSIFVQANGRLRNTNTKAKPHHCTQDVCVRYEAGDNTRAQTLSRTSHNGIDHSQVSPCKGSIQ